MREQQPVAAGFELETRAEITRFGIVERALGRLALPRPRHARPASVRSPPLVASARRKSARLPAARRDELAVAGVDQASASHDGDVLPAARSTRRAQRPPRRRDRGDSSRVRGEHDLRRRADRIAALSESASARSPWLRESPPACARPSQEPPATARRRHARPARAPSGSVARARRARDRVGRFGVERLSRAVGGRYRRFEQPAFAVVARVIVTIVAAPVAARNARCLRLPRHGERRLVRHDGAARQCAQRVGRHRHQAEAHPAVLGDGAMDIGRGDEDQVGHDAGVVASRAGVPVATS